MRRSNSALIVATTFVLAAVLAVPYAALADKKKPTTETPSEAVHLDYGKIQWTYTQQKHADTQHPAPKSGVSGSMKR
jgi:type VI protein secretion system component Hcp